MHNKNSGVTLIEMIIAISLLFIIASFNIVWIKGFLYTQAATLSLRQIQHAINYARSVAILHRETIIVCPSQDRFSCSNTWNSGIMVRAPNSHIRYFKMFFTESSFLYLQQSGFNNNKIDIQADGTTYTNGHFTYKNLSSNTLPVYYLYFNKMLRTYTK